MALQHDVRLLLGATGQACDVFSEYVVALSLLEVGNPWTFRLWRSDAAASAWEVLTASERKVRCGDWVGVTIDSALVLLGQVETVDTEDEPEKGCWLVISGRDIAAPAVDADADPRLNLGENTTLHDAITRLLAPLGIAATIGVPAAEARAVATGARRGGRGAAAAPRTRRQRVGRTHPQPGERIWGHVETACRKVGLMAWIAPLTERRMGVVLDVPDYAQAPSYRLERRLVNGRVAPASGAGGEILAGARRVSTAGVPTEVTVVGRGAHGDAPAARYRTQVANGALLPGSAVARDDVSEQLPPLLRWLASERARSVAACQQDAARALADANRGVRRYRCTVQGHGQMTDAGMRLYAINTVAHVRDDVHRVNEAMLIERVEFHGSRGGGATTQLTLHPLGAIALTPDPEAA